MRNVLPDRDGAPLRALLLGVLLSTLAGVSAAQSGEPVGKATLVRGAVTAHVVGRTARILGRGSQVFAGDVVTTGARSVGVLEMVDGTRIALRPGTVFRVEAFDTEPQRENALLRLFRGGMRTVTGFLSKRNRNAFRVRAATATIGIRGTTFDVRMCEDDCATEARRAAPVAGRIAMLRGQVKVVSAGGVERLVRLGARVREGDTVRTGIGAFAILLLRDRSRVSVAQDSAFRVDRMRHDESRPSAGQAILSFLRGGLRLLTGAIAHNAPDRYRIRTPVATIGIRGTGIDLQCQGLCVSPPGSTVDPNTSDGMTADVWQGGVDFDGQYPLSDGALFFTNLQDEPLPVPGVPREFIVPRPDQVALPQLPPDAVAGRGVYVGCYEGECTLKGEGDKEIGMSAGESAVLGEGEIDPEPLGEPPGFMVADEFLALVNPDVLRTLERLGDLTGPQPGAGDGDLICEIR